MKPPRKVDLVWGLLIALTLSGTLLGESAEPGFRVTLAIAGIMAVKGRLVIDYFLELAHADPTLRWTVRLYALVIPLLLILTYLLGPQLASMTSL